MQQPVSFVLLGFTAIQTRLSAANALLDSLVHQANLPGALFATPVPTHQL
jgi:hypothetical protein